MLLELRRRGFATVDEPGRRIVAEELKRGGRELPWVDAVFFAARRYHADDVPRPGRPMSLVDIDGLRRSSGPLAVEPRHKVLESLI